MLEPFGEERADLRLGILAALTANLHRDPKTAALKPIDFMPYAERPEADPEVTARQLIGVLKGMSNGPAG